MCPASVEEEGKEGRVSITGRERSGSKAGCAPRQSSGRRAAIKYLRPGFSLQFPPTRRSWRENMTSTALSEQPSHSEDKFPEQEMSPLPIQALSVSLFLSVLALSVSVSVMLHLSPHPLTLHFLAGN